MKNLIKISNKFNVRYHKNCNAVPRELYVVRFTGWFAHRVWGKPYTLLQFVITKGDYKNKKVVYHAETKIIFCNRFHQNYLSEAITALLNRPPMQDEVVNLDELRGSTCLALIETDNRSTRIHHLIPIRHKRLLKIINY